MFANILEKRAKNEIDNLSLLCPQILGPSAVPLGVPIMSKIFLIYNAIWTEIARYNIHFDFTWIEHLINGIFVQFRVIFRV